jgi:hypothetical protein
MSKNSLHNQPLKYSVEESQIIAKTGKAEDCEDILFLDEHFLAVIDGATSKTSEKWGGETPGQVAARLVQTVLENLDPMTSANDAVESMTEKFREFYSENQVDTSLPGPSASFVALSLSRKEVWLVGDCQCMIGKMIKKANKKIDGLLSELRAVYIETELLMGKTIEDLVENDTGREFILPMLKRQGYFQNHPSSEYWYPVIDGSAVPQEGIIVEQIPTGTESIVLASDGYPELKESLQESENILDDILKQDPLMFKIHKSTKGKVSDHVSYDDRTYLKVALEWD